MLWEYEKYLGRHADLVTRLLEQISQLGHGFDSLEKKGIAGLRASTVEYSKSFQALSALNISLGLADSNTADAEQSAQLRLIVQQLTSSQLAGGPTYKAG